MAQAKSSKTQSTPYRVLIGFDYVSPVDGEPCRVEPGAIITDVPESDIARLESLSAITTQIEVPEEAPVEPEAEPEAEEPADLPIEEVIVITNEQEV